MLNIQPVLQKLQHQLIVSCQPEAQESFYNTAFVCGMAQAAALGGAAGLRLDSPTSIKAVKAQLDLPVIGIWKQEHPGSEVYITPTLAAAEAILASGAEIIAIDATSRQRPQESLAEIVSALKGRVCLMADVATLEEGLQAQQLGFDCVGTTLAGYTSARAATPGPDFDLLVSLLKELALPIIMEGRIWTPAEASQALNQGAHAVVVGSAITRPQAIVRQFIAQNDRISPNKFSTQKQRGL